MSNMSWEGRYVRDCYGIWSRGELSPSFIDLVNANEGRAVYDGGVEWIDIEILSSGWL